MFAYETFGFQQQLPRTSIGTLHKHSTNEPPSVEPKFSKPVSQTQGKVLFVKEVFKRTVMVQVVHVIMFVCNLKYQRG